jgi:diguanylate cyclase (GGDEF)-like protein
MLADFPLHIPAFLHDEIVVYPFFYAYLCIGTVASYTLSSWFAGRIAARLDRRIHKLEGLGMRDLATGLFDRRYLSRRLRGEIDRAVRLNHPLAWLVVKVEGFESLVRRVGQAETDEAMRDLAFALQLAGRDMDVLGRYDVDTLGVILPETGLYGASITADRMLTAASAAKFSGAGGTFGVTVNIGGAEIDREISRVDLLINAANEALAASRSEGPGKVVLHAPISHRGMAAVAAGKS